MSLADKIDIYLSTYNHNQIKLKDIKAIIKISSSLSDRSEFVKQMEEFEHSVDQKLEQINNKKSQNDSKDDVKDEVNKSESVQNQNVVV